tara:strand:+ start:519 stop:1742 length:1224 start_codon:yes stop_codon:yes gene_type:complete
MTFKLKITTYSIFCIALSSTLCIQVLADTFQLSSGSTLNGKLLNPDQDPRVNYQIQTDFGKVTLDAKQVTKASSKPMVVQQYEQSIVSLPDTVQAHLDMASKCKAVNLLKQHQFHLEQVLRLDPDNASVRQQLGYVKIGNQWHREDVHMRQQGYIRHGGRWRTVQEVTVLEANAQIEKEEIEWRTKIMRWESLILKNRPTATDAIKNMREIKDYRATTALAERLNERQLPREMKLMYLEILTEIGGAVPVQAMLKCITEETDDVMTQRCLDQLRDWQSRTAMSFFVGLLKSNDNQTVNNAANALGSLGMKDATLPLIEALVTTHQFQVGGGNNVNAGFSGNQPGLGGLQFGGKPKLVKREIQNRAALSALLAIVPEGVNYGLSEAQWMNWYIRMNTPRQVNLRRRGL